MRDAGRTAGDPHATAQVALPSAGAVRRLSGFLVLAALLVAWHATAVSGVYPRHLLPTPWAVLEAVVEAAASGELLSNVLVSLGRQAAGFLVAVLVGLPIGLAIGWWSPVQQALQILVRIVYPIPGVAWVPLAILWFGLGFESIVFAIFITAVFPILVNTATGVATIDEQYIRVTRVFGTPPWLSFRRVLLPAALPFILTGLRLGYGTGWRVIISAEIISATDGLGFMIDNARWQLRPDLVIGGMLIIGIVGLVVETLVFDWIERRTIEAWGMRRLSE